MAEPKIEGWNAQVPCPKCGGWAYVTANTEGESALIARTDAEIIREFVERVMTRYKQANEDEPMVYTDFDVAIEEELAAMEKQ